MLWRCSKLHRYLERVFITLNTLCSTKVAGNPKIALLGVISEGVLPDEMHTMWMGPLYLAHKLILQKCTSPTSQTHKQWFENLNYILKERKTYKHRGCPPKKGVKKIWSHWIDFSNLLYNALPSVIEERC